MAQHCPYDFSSIIVLNVHAKNDTTVIPNLKIVMYDTAGNLATRNKYQNNKWEKVIDYFWQNPAKTTFKGYIDNNNPAENEKIRFPFAKRNYVLVVSDYMDFTGYKIAIEDPSGKYNTKYIDITNKGTYSLCGTYHREDYKDRSGSEVIYQPIDVLLK